MLVVLLTKLLKSCRPANGRSVGTLNLKMKESAYFKTYKCPEPFTVTKSNRTLPVTNPNGFCQPATGAS